MVERVRLVVEFTMLRQRVRAMRQRAIHARRRIEQARQSHGAQRVDAVGILHDARFDGVRRQIGRKAVRFDGVGHASQFFCRKIQLRQPAARQRGCLARSQVAFGMVFRQVDQVVQIAGGHHGEGVGLRMVLQQDGGVAPDALQVVDVVGAVVAQAGRGQCQQAWLPLRKQRIHGSRS